MRIRFNWNTDEEWTEEPITGSGAHPTRRAILWVLLLAAAVTTLLLFWQQWRRVQQREAALAQEISGSQAVWQQAVRTHDRELFLLQLAKEDSFWVATQQQLFETGALLDRRNLGLSYRSQAEAATITVDLTPDWQAATAALPVTYSNATGAEVRLDQLFYYRRGENGWLQTAPPPDFWGATQSTTAGPVTATYPGRDAPLVQEMIADLAREIRALCASLAESGAVCPGDLAVSLRFETDPAVLLARSQDGALLLRQGRFTVPTPSLVGLPVNEDGYDALYAGYSKPILAILSQNLTPPLPLPQQDLQILCYPEEGRALRLYRYDPRADRWQQELGERAFRFLLPGPDGAGIILQDYTRGADAARLRLFYWHQGDLQLLFDQELRAQSTRPVGWASARQPRLVLQSVDSRHAIVQRLVDLTHCGPDGCALSELRGFTTWSSDGKHTLVNTGQGLWRGDGRGEPLRPLGEGLSPFWLSNDRYGFVRYDRTAGAPSMQVVTATVTTDLPHIVLPVQRLAAAIDDDAPPLLFISHVAVNPADPDLLLLAATTVASPAAKYNIFALRLSSGDLQLLQQFEQMPSGYPALLTAAGYPPFRLSPDGRWLLTTLLAGDKPTVWSFRLYDLQQQTEVDLTLHYPEYPAQFPFYDWSKDGEWLALVEDGYLRLVAPAYDYERVLPFQQDSCLFTAWTD